MRLSVALLLTSVVACATQAQESAQGDPAVIIILLFDPDKSGNLVFFRVPSSAAPVSRFGFCGRKASPVKKAAEAFP